MNKTSLFDIFNPFCFFVFFNLQNLRNKLCQIDAPSNIEVSRIFPDFRPGIDDPSRIPDFCPGSRILETLIITYNTRDAPRIFSHPGLLGLLTH